MLVRMGCLAVWSLLISVIDFSFHAVPSIVLLVDLLLLSPPWTITILPALGLSSAIAFGYWVWVEKCFEHNGWCVTGPMLLYFANN